MEEPVEERAFRPASRLVKKKGFSPSAPRPIVAEPAPEEADRRRESGKFEADILPRKQRMSNYSKLVDVRGSISTVVHSLSSRPKRANASAVEGPCVVSPRCFSAPVKERPFRAA